MTETKTIRLACNSCDRDDGDGISEVELSACIAAGWRDVHQVQTYEQACYTWEPDENGEPPQPDGYSVLDWMTHYGTCPECAGEEAAEEVRRVLRRAKEATHGT